MNIGTQEFNAEYLDTVLKYGVKNHKLLEKLNIQGKLKIAMMIFNRWQGLPYDYEIVKNEKK